MSLIKNTRSLPVYKEPAGFVYGWAIEAYEKHDAVVWHKSEIPLGQDVVDFAKADDREKEFITSVMKLFTQNDVQAGIGYDTMLRIFQPTEVKLMLRGFADREGTHIFNYANFTDTIGLPASVYTDFLDVPVMSTKCEYLDKAKVKKYEDLKGAGLTDAEVGTEYRRSIARMLAVYAGGLEGTELMAQFAMLLMFQDQGKYPGLCTIVEWSINKRLQILSRR